MSIKIETEELCYYGCGKKANYKNKSGNLMCCEFATQCSVNRQINSIRGKQAKIDKNINNKEIYKNLTQETKDRMKWSKGKTKDSDPRIKKQSETIKQRIKEGIIVPTFLGKKHTKETKEKCSKNAKGWLNGCRAKWYKVKNGDEIVNVQGRMELIYALWLNDNNIQWQKNKSECKISYKRNSEDITRTYYPDFLVGNEIIEIKGFFYKSEKYGIDDEEKMKLVKEQNPNINVRIIFKKELEKITNTKMQYYKHLTNDKIYTSLKELF